MAVRSRTRCLLLASSDGDLDRRLRSALDAVPDVEVIGIPDPPTLLATVAQGSCGLVLLGPALDSPEILAPLRALDPIVPVLVVSPVEDPYAIVAAMRAGASDYLLSRDLARLPDLVSRHLRGDGDPVPGTGPREATARLRARLGDLRRAMREGDRSADLCGQTLEELQAGETA